MAILKHTKIKTLGTIFGAVLVGVGVIVVSISVLTLSSAQGVNETWTEFARGPAAKTAIVGELRDAIGYGGMVHQFKNFVLRQDRPRIVKIQAKLLDITVALTAYRALGVNNREAAALTAIENTFIEYAEAVAVVEKLAVEGAGPRAIDQAVKISDRPALEALKVLDAELASDRKASGDRVNAEISYVEKLTSGASLAVGLILACVIAGFFWFIRIRLLKPLAGLGATMEHLASGDTGIDIPSLESRDEIGSMARSVQCFKDGAIERQKLEAAQAEEQAAKDRRAAVIEELSQSFDRDATSILQAVSSASSELRETAQSMSATADAASDQASSVARASESASSNVSAAAASTEELSSSIGEISRQVSQSNDIANKAVSEAERASVTVEGLSSAANKIGEVVNLIRDIAEQTNLLALNATIEAARAGEAGKGFAVVASEVKNLANQTAKATEEISAQIDSMQSASADTVGAIGAVREIIDQIGETATTIATAMEEQNAATQAITRSVQEAASGTQEVSSGIGGVTQAASDTGTAASHVLGASDELSKQSELLRNQVETFLQRLRAA